MSFVDFTNIPASILQDQISSWFRECRPRFLVVVDTNLNYDPDTNFGLTQFVETLENSRIHGLTPIVTKASRYPAIGADINDFDFTDSVHGLSINRYDVIFLMGYQRETEDPLPQSQIDAITEFMQAGGGVFATGDHEDHGGSLSGNIPRVRNMRYWSLGDTPNIADSSRISTNQWNSNNIEEFQDQSDSLPQPLYLNYNSSYVSGVGRPHPMMEININGTADIVNVFPDHPHEGECYVPAQGALNTNITFNGAQIPEWPNGNGPEAVAYSMSHGTGFLGKSPLTPRSFISINAYEGHRESVGRIVTDSTWHHYVNINIDGSGNNASRSGFYEPDANGDLVETEDLIKIRQYYVNMAEWLMPGNVRRCLYLPTISIQLADLFLRENLELPDPKNATFEQQYAAGEMLYASLRRTIGIWRAEQMLDDIITDVFDKSDNLPAMKTDNVFSKHAYHMVGLATLAHVTASAVRTLQRIRSDEKNAPSLQSIFYQDHINEAKKSAKRAIKAVFKQLESLEKNMKTIK